MLGLDYSAQTPFDRALNTLRLLIHGSFKLPNFDTFEIRVSNIVCPWTGGFQGGAHRTNFIRGSRGSHWEEGFGSDPFLNEPAFFLFFIVLPGFEASSLNVWTVLALLRTSWYRRGEAQILWTLVPKHGRSRSFKYDYDIKCTASHQVDLRNALRECTWPKSLGEYDRDVFQCSNARTIHWFHEFTHQYSTKLLLLITLLN